MQRLIPTLMLALAPALATAQSPSASEPALPRWEAGLAAGGGLIPDYPGADRSH